MEVNTMKNKQNYVTPKINVVKLKGKEEVLLASGNFNLQNISLKSNRESITAKQLDVK
jgi:hypothetical protein